MQDPFYTTNFEKNSCFLLSNLEMSEIDKMAMDDGIPSIKLMEAAGEIIARICSQIIKENSFKKILILCGPGNNGGDGYFAGHYLKKDFKGIEIFSETPVDNLKGDAKKAFEVYNHKTKTRTNYDDINGYDMIIDAFFGAGLSMADIWAHLGPLRRPWVTFWLPKARPRSPTGSTRDPRI